MTASIIYPLREYLGPLLFISSVVLVNYRIYRCFIGKLPEDMVEICSIFGGGTMKAEKWLLGLDWLIGFALLGFILFIDAGNFFLRVFWVAVYFFMAIPSLFTSKSLSLGLAPAYRHKAGSYR